MTALGQKLELQRPDWAILTTLDGLCQRGGVERSRLPALLIKELVDNALDASGDCRFGLLPEDQGAYVEDDGPGFGLSAEELAKRFSIARGLISGKLWRRPTRGALGNGLRLIAGAAVATEGRIILRDSLQDYLLRPRDDGSCSWRRIGPSQQVGTRIELRFGDALRFREADFDWARKARFLNHGELYKGRPWPQWFCAESFAALLRAAGDHDIQEVLSRIHGGQRLRELRGPCSELDFTAACEILRRLRQDPRSFNPLRIGAIGAQRFLGDVYQRSHGTLQRSPGRGGIAAELPWVLETWTSPLDFGSSLEFAVNRSPVAAPIAVFQDENRVIVQGCGLNFEIEVPGLSQLGFSARSNLMIPYAPLTSDGKRPELSELNEDLAEQLRASLQRLARLQRRENSFPGKPSLREVVSAHLQSAAAKASGEGRFRFSQRQLYYVMRPIVQQICGEALAYAYFTRLLTRIENESGPIKGLYRDPRGYLYHPHERRRIPLGTQLVEDYQRPPWTFNKILYIEKKGLLETLCSVDWPERNDCAILAAEGQATRADKDLLDLLGSSPEPITIFCIHDADAYGTMIFEALQGHTEARKARSFEIVNLGLEAWEALALGLEVEDTDHERLAPVANYVTDPYWRDWLQKHRVELNAMTPGRFIDWLDSKMQAWEAKLIPPQSVIEGHLRSAAERRLHQSFRAIESERAQLSARIEARRLAHEQGFEKLLETTSKDLSARLRSAQQSLPEKLWREAIERIAQELSEAVTRLALRGEATIPSLEWIRPENQGSSQVESEAEFL